MNAELYECWLYECWLELSDYSKSCPLHPAHPIYSQQLSGAQKAAQQKPTQLQEDPMLNIPAPWQTPLTVQTPHYP